MDEPLLTFPDTEFSDWEGLHALLVAAFAYMDARIDPPSSMKQITAENLREKAKAELLLTCKSGDELIAATFVAMHPDSLYIGKLAVREDFRRQGLSRRMIEVIEDFARVKRLPRLVLQTRVELTENHRAFAALGFVKTAETSHAGYDRATSITMTKDCRQKPR